MAMADQAKNIGEKARETGQQALQQVDRATSAPMRIGEQMPSKLYMGAVAGSILASAGLFLAGRTAAGIFVGLWAPTLLNLGLFNKLLQPSQESMQGATSGGYEGSSGFGAEAGTTRTGSSF
jgi:hypothetical protein